MDSPKQREHLHCGLDPADEADMAPLTLEDVVDDGHRVSNGSVRR